MIYGLFYINRHPLSRLHGAVGCFLVRTCKGAIYGETLYPSWFRPVFRACRKLQRLSENVHRIVHMHPAAIRDQVRGLWHAVHPIEQLCRDVTLPPPRLTGLPNNVAIALDELFVYFYEDGLTTKSFERAVGSSLRKHYEAFRSREQYVCPFCGLETYADRSSKLRSQYDHYLPKGKYPLAAINFNNLVPMCHACNASATKGQKDVLLTPGGVRRQAYYPYGNVGGTYITLDCTRQPSVDDSGDWSATVTPRDVREQAKFDTWASVFDIPGRFEARVGEQLQVWIETFLALRRYPGVPLPSVVRGDLAEEAERLREDHWVRRENNALLRAALFTHLAESASDAQLQGLGRLAITSQIRLRFIGNG